MEININEGVEKLKKEIKQGDNDLQKAMENYPIGTPTVIAMGLFTLAISAFPENVEFSLKALVSETFSLVSLVLCMIVVLSTIIKWNRLNPKPEKVTSQKRVQLTGMPFEIHGTYTEQLANNVYKWSGLCGNHLPYLVQYHKGKLWLWLGEEGKDRKSVSPAEYKLSWSEVIETNENEPKYNIISNTHLQRKTEVFLSDWKLT